MTPLKCTAENLRIGWKTAKTTLSEEDYHVTIPELSLSFEDGLMLPLMGASGGGKSTLMMVLAALKWPLAGTLTWQLPGEPEFTWGANGLSSDKAAYLRRCCFGFAFQRSTLTPDLTVESNLVYPQLLMNETRTKSKNKQYAQALEKAKEVLASVHVREEHLQKFPHQLSGGQQQRVALAQAIVHEPQVIFADEPTGSLDPVTREEVMGVLMDLAREKNKCVIWVTHHGETDIKLTGVEKVLLVDDLTAKIVSKKDYYDWEEQHKEKIRQGRKQ